VEIRACVAAVAAYAHESLGFPPPQVVESPRSSFAFEPRRRSGVRRCRWLAVNRQFSKLPPRCHRFPPTLSDLVRVVIGSQHAVMFAVLTVDASTPHIPSSFLCRTGTQTQPQTRTSLTCYRDGLDCAFVHPCAGVWRGICVWDLSSLAAVRLSLYRWSYLQKYSYILVS
jgi:hypothetical protein